MNKLRDDETEKAKIHLGTRVNKCTRQYTMVENDRVGLTTLYHKVAMYVLKYVLVHDMSLYQYINLIYVSNSIYTCITKINTLFTS